MSVVSFPRQIPILFASSLVYKRGLPTLTAELRFLQGIKPRAAPHQSCVFNPNTRKEGPRRQRLTADKSRVENVERPLPSGVRGIHWEDAEALLLWGFCCCLLARLHNLRRLPCARFVFFFCFTAYVTKVEFIRGWSVLWMEKVKVALPSWFTVGGTLGAMVGSLVGLKSESRFLHRATIGTVAGVLLSVELFRISVAFFLPEGNRFCLFGPMVSFKPLIN